MARGVNPPAREPSRPWWVRRSTTATSAPPSAGSRA